MIKFYCSEQSCSLKTAFDSPRTQANLPASSCFATQFDTRFYFGHKTAKKNKIRDWASNDFVNASVRDDDDEPRQRATIMMNDGDF